MKTTMMRHGLSVAAAALLFSACSLSYQNRGGVDAQAGALAPQRIPDLAQYRSPLNATVLDRTFRTGQAMYLANEMNESGFPFFERAVTNGLALGDPEFLYITTTESYWYSRYNMSALVSESRLGIHTVFGPYVTEWALSEGRANVNRNRGEYMRSNKGVLLQEIVPMYLARTGFPRRFEEASPLMLTFASGDPHYTRALDKGVGFESTENLIRDADLQRQYGSAQEQRLIGMGVAGNDQWRARINYRENFLTLRWNHGRMEHTIDLGAEGQVLVKQALWMEHFFQQNHHGGYLGNDPEQGFRGAMLNLMAVNKMLMLKGALLYDGERLTGADPREVEPGSHYFPHRVNVRMRMVGDLPPRPEEFSVADASSQLFDQASLLWGLSEYYHFADPTHQDNWDEVFGANPPYDGSIMDQKYIVLADGLARLVLRNIQAMHQTANGVLVSEWQPEVGTGSRISTRDIGMAMVALANYASRLPQDSPDVAAARAMLEKQANFVIQSMQGQNDGAVADFYDFATRSASQGPRTLEAQAFAVRGLLAAYSLLNDERFKLAAEKAYDFMNANLWDNTTGVYRSHVDASETEYTPLVLGATIAAMREMILVNRDAQELNRFKRFWVQGINGSGIQQSEYEETGETDFFTSDLDGDGIPRMEYGDGSHGIAPVFASRVSILTPLSPVAAATATNREAEQE